MRKGARERHTEAARSSLIRGAVARARREAGNALRQFDLAIRFAQDYVDAGRSFRLEQSHILQLHKACLDGLDPLAGAYRNVPVSISGSMHQPPEPFLVAGLVHDMCEYVNKRAKTPLHACAYV